MPTAKPAPKKSPATTRLKGNGKEKSKKKTQAKPALAPDTVSIETALDQGWLLIALVLLGGMSSLAVEMVAARLMAPYFGDSQFVWATLIGLTLIYLTIGYALGGRLADRAPRPLALYQLTAVAAATIGLIPPLASAVLGWAAEAFGRPESDITAGPLIAALVLFSLPVTLLGCVSPYAIRLRVKAVGTAGSTAGRLYALSTVGSILGTFVPVFWLMPHYGVRATIFLFAGLLMGLSAVGMLVEARKTRR